MKNDDLGASKEAKRLAAMLLDVLAGSRTPPQAAEALGVSLPRYYQLEDRCLRGLLAACETQPRGRQANAEVRRRARRCVMKNGDLGASKEAKRLAAMLLDVLAGSRTPPQAAEALGVSLPRYYQLEDRGLNGLLAACETRPRGRQANATTELHALTKENERLKRELGRYQSLVRLTQRTVGVQPPPTPSKVKVTGKRRKRRPTVRALRRANRLREEADEDAGVENVGVGTE